MEQLPLYVSLVFAITTLLAIWFFYRAAHHSKAVLFFLLGYILLQAGISYTGFYQDTTTVPPRFIYLVGPPMLLIILLFLLPAGRKFIHGLDQKRLTLLHVVRIPVEMVLFWLFVHQLVPQIMTFEGTNFDILSGMTAPLVWYFGYVKKAIPRTFLLLWNFICLGLLVNIVAHAILSAPTPFQKFGFEQPNTGVLYFPFIWLPCCIVPLVLLSHLATIKQLLLRKDNSPINNYQYPNIQS